MLTITDFLAFCDIEESDEIKQVDVEKLDVIQICEI